MCRHRYVSSDATVVHGRGYRMLNVLIKTSILFEPIKLNKLSHMGLQAVTNVRTVPYSMTQQLSNNIEAFKTTEQNRFENTTTLCHHPYY